MHEQLVKALAVTAELTGTDISLDALRAMVDTLKPYPQPWVAGALNRCRRECRGRLTLADIIQRLEDGRPSAEEAWAMMPRSESQTVVWTDEMREAYSLCAPLLRERNPVQARLVFRDAYGAAVARARDTARPVLWTATLGHDARERESVILEAVTAKRITSEFARLLLPYRDEPGPQVKALTLGVGAAGEGGQGTGTARPTLCLPAGSSAGVQARAALDALRTRVREGKGASGRRAQASSNAHAAPAAPPVAGNATPADRRADSTTGAINPADSVKRADTTRAAAPPALSTKPAATRRRPA